MPDGEGKEPVVEEIQPDKDGKYPEVISWGKYVGIKEAWGRAKEKVASLEEHLKGAISTEEHTRIKAELEKVSGELKATREKSTTEKREYLIKKGIPESELKGMSEEALTAAVRVLEQHKPKPDLGGGGGGTGLKGSPMELARQAYGNK